MERKEKTIPQLKVKGADGKDYYFILQRGYGHSMTQLKKIFEVVSNVEDKCLEIDMDQKLVNKCKHEIADAYSEFCGKILDICIIYGSDIYEEASNQLSKENKNVNNKSRYDG